MYKFRLCHKYFGLILPF